MAHYIQFNSRPHNAKQFATAEEAIADFCAPAYAGAKPAEVQMINATEFRSMGLVYQVVSGNNPKIARDAAIAARPAGFRAATAKQVEFIRKLNTRVGGGSIDVRAKMAYAGDLSSNEASRLIDYMLSNQH